MESLIKFEETQTNFLKKIIINEVLSAILVEYDAKGKYNNSQKCS